MKLNLSTNLHHYYLRALEDIANLEEFRIEVLECKKLIGNMWKHYLISDREYRELDDIIEYYAEKWFDLRCK